MRARHWLRAVLLLAALAAAIGSYLYYRLEHPPRAGAPSAVTILFPEGLAGNGAASGIDQRRLGPGGVPLSRHLPRDALDTGPRSRGPDGCAVSKELHARDAGEGAEARPDVRADGHPRLDRREGKRVVARGACDRLRLFEPLEERYAAPGGSDGHLCLEARQEVDRHPLPLRLRL